MEKLKKYWPYLLLLFLLVPSVWNLFKPGYFNMHDDLQVMRVFEMGKCFNDGQIPCRWSPDMEYGYGQAMFNFYSAFPYYLGQLIRTITPLSIIWTVKILFAISFIGAGFGMFYLAREFFGKWGGLAAAVLYTYAPYHSVDVYVRGAMSESFALMLLPFLWLAFYRLIKNGTFKNIFLAAITLGLLLTTHNVSSLIYAPFTAIWVAFWIVKDMKWKSIKNIVLAGLLGIGVSAFFTLPIAIESKFVQLQWLTTDYLNFQAHFVTLHQLFVSRIWGYGPSIFGPDDKLSFAVGWPNWWLAVPAGFLALFWLKNKKLRGMGLLVIMLLVLASFSLFMTHPRSTFIWNSIPTLAIIQFPWRFLGIAIFLLSFASAVLIRGRYAILISVLVMVLAIGLNIGFFKPEYYFTQETDQTKLSGEEYIIQQKSATLDYLPTAAKMAAKEEAFPAPIIATGSGTIKNYSKRTNSFFFDADIYKAAEVQVPVMYYPGWKVINGGKVIPSYPSGDYGVITFKLPEGQYIIQGRFTDTWDRSLGDALTIGSFVALFLGAIVVANKRKFLWFQK